MEKEQWVEWFQLQEVAIKLLEMGHKTKLKRRHLQLLILPAFKAGLTYEIFEQGPLNQPTFTAAVTCWRRDLDLPKFASPVERLKHPYPLHPTVEENDVEITSEFAQIVLDKFRCVAVPIISSQSGLWLDGTNYEIKLWDDSTSSRFSWWTKAPPEWQPLETAFQEVVQLLEAQFTPP